MTHAVQNQFVLNVDDNDAARYTKSRILKRAGFNVLEAATGTEALQMARERCPDLVLLDVQLPDINGFEVCQHIKRDPKTSNILVLQTSASYVAVADKIKALEEGADNYLFEPIEPEELVANVKALLRLALAEREIRESNKRKDEFIAMLAHELRNPLGPIRNSVDLLRQLAPDVSGPQKEAREMIARQTDHMVRLVNDLLDVSRVSQGKIAIQKKPVRLQTFVHHAIDNVASALEERRHRLTVDLPENDVWVEGDEVRLVQVVSNLLHNAVKFTGHDGEINITSTSSEDALEINISDNGIGIPADKIDTIFDLFAQAHSPADGGQGGVGIGLSLVKQLMALHGGHIAATSDGEGKGSNFRLRIPVTRPPASDASPSVEETGGARQDAGEHGRNVLVVDDNADAADIIGMLLELSGYRVRLCYSAASALELLGQQVVEVVILDIGLPDMNGRELAQRIRSMPDMRHARLIALSGFGQKKDVEDSLQAGIDCHLAKPVSHEALLQAIQPGE